MSVGRKKPGERGQVLSKCGRQQRCSHQTRLVVPTGKETTRSGGRERSQKSVLVLGKKKNTPKPSSNIELDCAAKQLTGGRKKKGDRRNSCPILSTTEKEVGKPTAKEASS